MIKFLLDKFKKGFGKTRQFFSEKIGRIFSGFKKVDEQVINSLEEALILADVGVESTKKIINRVREDYKRHKLKTTNQLQDYLKAYIKDILKFEGEIINMPSTPPAVFLIVGVNGVGKTTSIAKLAKFLKDQQKKVLVCAGDTHRAAAIEQLEIWCKRADVDIVKHQIGADPGAVVFDACDAAIARKCDCLIIDTAGRIQTKVNLMNELAKIKRVIQKKIPSAPHETLLVLDATTGQNAISQARLFSEAVKLSGIFLAKLDGTAKGGIIIAIKDIFNIPIKFVGTGETLDDISVFSPEEFVKVIFE